MLHRVNSLNGYNLQATDGDLGKVKDVFFDDEKWTIRYLVVETGSWLNSRQVLISPYSVIGIDQVNEAITVRLNQEQVKNSPDIDTHQPVSRQMEGDFSRYYGLGNYWIGPELWGTGAYPMVGASGTVDGAAIHDRAEELLQHAADNPEDYHLRSADHVKDHHIQGTDEEIGHVEDFVFDDETWALRYFIVDTRNWWPGGRKVLLATHWIDSIDWSQSLVKVSLTQEQIRNSPEYNPDHPLDRDTEAALHVHYGLRNYWE
ncbi:MAG: PRC-barrel domain-containing protein [Burkholderiaceae bacterium]